MMRQDRGVALLFVLVILALCSAVVVAMVTMSEGSITRSRFYDEAAAAAALVSAGEATAVIALRRDLLTGPGLDHAGEAWAAVNQAEVAIKGGRFSLTLTDAQGRFNLGNLATGGVMAQTLLGRIIAAVDLKPELAAQIIAAMTAAQPPARLDQLQGLMGKDDLTRLATMVTILPQPTDVNVNAAPVAVLAVMLGNPVQAKLLEARRSKRGFVTPEDVSALGIILPAGLGYQSACFALHVTAQSGDTVVAEDAMILRRLDDNGVPVAHVVARQLADNAMAAGLPLPPSN